MNHRRLIFYILKLVDISSKLQTFSSDKWHSFVIHPHCCSVTQFIYNNRIYCYIYFRFTDGKTANLLGTGTLSIFIFPFHVVPEVGECVLPVQTRSGTINNSSTLGKIFLFCFLTTSKIIVFLHMEEVRYCRTSNIFTPPTNTWIHAFIDIQISSYRTVNRCDWCTAPSVISPLQIQI